VIIELKRIELTLMIAPIFNSPRPTKPFTPPRFLTRKRADFLKAQFRTKPKSDWNTHVLSASRHVHPASRTGRNKAMDRSFDPSNPEWRFARFVMFQDKYNYMNIEVSFIWSCRLY